MKNRLCITGGKQKFYLLILILFFVFYLFGIRAFLYLEKLEPSGDDIHHLDACYHYYDYLVKGEYINFFLKPPTFYPPLPYQTAAVYMLIAGSGITQAVMSQGVFLLLLVISIYYLGISIMDEITGLLAAFTVLTIHFFADYATRFYPDIPGAAALAFCLLCLVKCKGFKDRKWTNMLFVALAAAALIRIQSLMLIAVPFLTELTLYARNEYGHMGKEERKQSGIYLILASAALLSAAAISGILGKNLMNATGIIIYRYMNHWINNPSSNDGIVSGLIIANYGISLIPLVLMAVLLTVKPVKNSTFSNTLRGVFLFFLGIWHFYGLYPRFILDFSRNLAHGGQQNSCIWSWLVNFYIVSGPLITVFAITGLLVYIPGKWKTRRRNIVILCFISSVILLTSFPINDIRYVVSALAPIALVAVFWIPVIKAGLLRTALYSLVVMAGIWGLSGWFFHDIPYVHRGSLFVLNQTGINPGDFSARPPNRHGMGIPQLARLVDILSPDDNYVLVWADQDSRFSNLSYWALPLHYKFITGRELICNRQIKDSGIKSLCLFTPFFNAHDAEINRIILINTGKEENIQTVEEMILNNNEFLSIPDRDGIRKTWPVQRIKNQDLIAEIHIYRIKDN